MLRGYIQKIFKNYQREKTNDFIGNPIVRLIEVDFPSYLREISPKPDNYVIRGNAGRGAFTEAPYFAIMDREITDKVGKGYYVIYIFSKDTNRLYLSLNQAITGTGANSNQDAIQHLKAKASRYRQYLSETPNKFPLKTLSLGNPSFLGRYEVANVYGKEYMLDDLPSEDELESDLNEMLHLYKKLKKKIPRIWKITPGSTRIEDQKNLWPLLEKEGFIGIGWLHDTHSYTEFQTLDELKEAIIEVHPSYKDTDPNQAAKMVWDFTHNIKEGDIVVANKGLRSVRGIGIIRSDYIGPTNPENPGIFNYFWHLRKVDWIITDELELDQNLFDIKTVTKLTEDKWNEIKQAFISTNQDYEQIISKIENTSYKIREGDNNITIRDSLELIFKELPFAKKRGEKPKQHEIGRAFLNIRDDIFEIAKSINPEKSYHSIAYYQSYGNWYKKPYIYIEDQANKDIFGHWDQHFVGFWFKEDLQGVYLSLEQSRNYAQNLLSKKLGHYSEEDLQNYFAGHDNLIKEQLRDSVVSIDFTEESVTTAFNDMVLYGKYYDKNNLPSNDQIESDFKELFTLYSSLKPDEVGPIGPKITFFEYLTSKGYLFDSKLVENFLLSLKVKPFVILTGNSGTGKTKVAQLFAEYLNLNMDGKQVKEVHSEILKLNRSITTYSKKNNGGWRFKPQEISLLLSNAVLNEFDEISDLILELREDDLPIRGTGYIEMSEQAYDENLQYYLYYDEESPFYDVMHRMDNDNVDIYLLQKQYLRIGNKKHEIVPVGANWTENRHVVGFYNVITEKYQKTQSLNLILSALGNWKDDEYLTVPYFLILDEMNLSHVERYFSDFLSVMESLETMPLYDKDYGDVPGNLKVPKNLFVIGTVNVDETTYMFSPKVLDRANTIEFLTQSPHDYMNKSFENTQPSGDVEYLQNPLSDLDNIFQNNDLRNCNIDELRDLMGHIKIKDGYLFWDMISSEINKIYIVLKKAGFDFGFRVVNEVMRFMYVAWKYEGSKDTWDNWERYFDAQIKQKMLPKLHGSQRTLQDIIKVLFEICYGKKIEKDPRLVSNKKIDSAKYLTAALKLREMDKVLYEQRYVAFIN